jgi:hypothetical protein
MAYMAIYARMANTLFPDAVGYLAQFNSNPGIAHWEAVKQLLHYLKGTTDYASGKRVIVILTHIAL